MALEKLKTYEGIIIKPSDKGGNIVVMSEVQNIGMCYKILKNRSWYKQISILELKVFQKNFENMINVA